MGLLHTLRFITRHPLTRAEKARTLLRFLRWQVGGRLSPGPVVVPFVNDARLVIRPGLTGATGNLYTGLNEFEDMAFLLHLLRPDDAFADIGANVGSYAVLAGKAIGARCIAAEPVTATYAALIDNVNINGIERSVRAVHVAVGREEGVVEMTTGLDAANHVAAQHESGQALEQVRLTTLDDLCRDIEPILIKIDVEGFESEVLAGGSKTLARESLVAIIMETNSCAELYGKAVSDPDEHLRSIGFESYRYDPRERTLHGLATHNASGNTIYIRGQARAAERVASAPSFWVLNQRI